MTDLEKLETELLWMRLAKLRFWLKKIGYTKPAQQKPKERVLAEPRPISPIEYRGLFEFYYEPRLQRREYWD